MKNAYLRSAEKMLKKQKFYTEFRDDNILEVCMSENDFPFAFLVIEEEQFPGIVISFAIDYHNTYQTADLVINLMHIAPLALGEAFYISKNKTCYWDEDAEKYFLLECDQNLLKESEAISNVRH